MKDFNVNTFSSNAILTSRSFFCSAVALLPDPTLNALCIRSNEQESPCLCTFFRSSSKVSM